MNSPNQARPASSNYRWVICGLLFFATTFNYLDRQVISYLKDPIFCAPPAQGGFGWTNTDFAYLTSFFTGVYACFTVVVGWIIDKIGTKLGLALSLTLWSIFGIANAFVEKRAIFPPRSKPSPNGFPNANALWRPRFSIPVPMPAPWSPRCSCRGA
jgi:sugar phosphate permease